MTTSRKAKLLEMAKALPDTKAKQARDPIAKQRQKISFDKFRASFVTVARCHLYVSSELGASIQLPQDTEAGWRSLYEAAIAAEASRPIDTSAPRRPKLELVDNEYARMLERCEQEDAQHYSHGGTDQYMGAS